MRDPVVITMDGPGKNALGTPMMAFLRASLAASGDRPVLLTGAGDAFSAGLDLKEVARLDAAAMRGFLLELEATCDALYRHPAPTVAAINGHAIAGGAVLALCCDERFAVDDPRIKIGLNETALGLQFPPGIFAMMRDRIPRASQARVLLGAGLFDPATSAHLGLVDAVVPDVLAVAGARIAALARLPAATYAATKAEMLVPRADAARRERFERDVLPSWTDPALADRLGAALAKRRP
jgi:enoyl-CoA hydratase